MKVYYLITGLLRSFISSLYPFLQSISDKIDSEFIIYTTNELCDSKFLGPDAMEQLRVIRLNPRYKLIYDSMPITTPNTYSQREKNTVYQWFRIQSAFNYIKTLDIDDTDIIIRLRPDIYITSTPDQFIQYLNAVREYKGIYIPLGNDLFNETYRSLVSTPINDQIAFGQYKYMKDYCNLFSEVNLNLKIQPIISEQILYDHLYSKGIPITRIELYYRLCLSECKIIAIAGDSGVGKSTIVNALQKVFPYDSNLILEADRYHKWERHDDNWKTINHLSPEANYLEYMTNDTYRLKLGESIEQVDYNHSTGKFTSPQSIQPKPFIFLCGLHTLYKSELRISLDLKVYIDVETELKRYWKVRRDIQQRGYSKEKANTIFNERIHTYNEFILPQKKHADIIISYYTNEASLTGIHIDNMPNIECSISFNNNITQYINSFLKNVSKNINKELDKTVYLLNNTLTRDEVILFLPKSYYKYVLDTSDELPSIFIIQCVFILILLEPTI
jgi:uridine kinase